MTRKNELLKDAANEIRQLRQHNALMAARLNVFDDMMMVLNTEPKRPVQGCSPDIVQEIEKNIEESENEPTGKT